MIPEHTPPNTSPSVSAAIDRGLELLFERQLDSGELEVRVWRPGASGENKEDSEVDSAPFATAQVIYSLAFIDHHLARTIIERGARFLAARMEGKGLWRYWTRDAEKVRAIPPDLDDTCCSAYALARAAAIAPEGRGRSWRPPPNRSILLANRDRGGRFYTWFLPRLSWPPPFAHLAATIRELPFLLSRHPFWRLTEAEPDDVDCGVNANAILYLGEGPRTRGAVEYLIERLGDGSQLSGDKWYLDPCTLCYMASRPYFQGTTSLEPLLRPILERLDQLRRDDGGYGGALDTALAACTRLNFRQPPAKCWKEIAFLLAAQENDGAWARAPFYYGGPKRARCWGSREITTALCLETLARCMS